MTEPGGTALLVVDVQNDFCAGGALPVPGSDHVIRALNRHITEATAAGFPVYASRDWHPPVTSHFKAYGGPWPPHCIQDSEGARFHPALRLPASTIVVTTGDAPDAPGYSAFEGRTPDGTSFGADLQARGIRHLYVGGLATDYCVKHSVVDALAAGIAVTVLTDAIAGIDPQDSEHALEEMQARGARVEAGALQM